MLGKLIPLVIGLVGLGAGVGAGLALRPAPDVEAAVTDDAHHDTAAPASPGAGREMPKAPPAPAIHDDSEFVALSNQFVFPLVEEGEVVALVVVSLSLEVSPGQTEAVYAREPKLQDGFLRVMLDHANAGGFRGAFTANDSMERLRRALLERGREDLGEALYDVLILNINRQSV
jgi:hypothetical protein